MRYGNNHYISCDESYIPADDYIVGCGVVPFGGVDVFIGYTSEAYGLPRIYSPSHPPYNQEAYVQDGSESASSQESTDSDLHFVGMTGLGSDSQPNSQDPESILPALQDDAMSDAGSRSTVHVNVDSDSEEDSASMFEQRVKQCFVTPEPSPSEAATGSSVNMQQVFVADVTGAASA